MLSECSTNWPAFCNFVEDRISVGMRADPRLILIYIISQLEYESFWLIEELSKPPGTALENSTVDHWVCGDLLPVSLCGICLVWYSKDSDLYHCMTHHTLPYHTLSLFLPIWSALLLHIPFCPSYVSITLLSLLLLKQNSLLRIFQWNPFFCTELKFCLC